MFGFSTTMAVDVSNRWHDQVRQTESEEKEEETESEEGRKRRSWGTIRQTCPGHVARVRVRGGDDSPPPSVHPEHLGALWE